VKIMLNELFKLQDKKYGDFTASLIPTINRELVIGVRTPAVRAFAKRIKDSDSAKAFIQTLPHHYYEENNLHGFLICEFIDFDECIAALDAFLPYVDNWATCDGLRPVCFKKNTNRLIPHIDRWLASSYTYTVRFGIEMLMTYYLDEYFSVEHLRRVSSITSNEYYINMMIAWYFATALAKQYDATIPYLEKGLLSPWVHNKTIQKARESHRITGEQKEYLKTLKRNVN